MDSLSTTASTIALIGVVTGSLTVLRQFHDAPRFVHSMVQDFTGLKAVMVEIEQTILSTSHMSGHSPSVFLLEHIQSAHAKLLEVERLVTSKFLRRASNGVEARVNRFACLKSASRLENLQSELQTIKSNLSTLLGVSAACDSSRAANAINDLVHANHTSIIIREQHHYEVLQALLQQNMAMQRMGIQMDLLVSHESHERLSNLGVIQHRVTPGFGTYGNNHSDKEIEQATLHATTMTIVKGHHVMGGDFSTSTVTMSFNSHKKKCNKNCTCLCHSKRHIGSPPLLRGLFGDLQIQYMALPFTENFRHSVLCGRQSSPLAQVKYTFPSWLLYRMVLATVTVRSPNVYELSIKAPRIVPDSSEIFSCAARGNVQEMQALFETGIASVYDVDVTSGVTALAYAMDRGQAKMWKFLLEAGADAFHLNNSRQAAIDNACTKVMANRLPEELVDALREDFETSDYLQTIELPPLHQVVLGIVEACLETQMLLSLQHINDIDWQGRTALSWAAARGDAKAVKLLLDHGADPNLAALNGTTPLQLSARARTADCMEMLLEFGAGIDRANTWNQTALTYSTTLHDDVSLVEPLVQAGANIDHGDIKGWTAMMKAADRNNSNQVAYLLSRGAIFGEADGWGFRSLSAAISNGFCEILESILASDHAVRWNRIDVKTLVGLAEKSGNGKVCDIVRDSRLGELSSTRYGNDFVHEFVPPREVAFTVSPESKMISDGNWL